MSLLPAASSPHHGSPSASSPHHGSPHSLHLRYDLALPPTLPVSPVSTLPPVSNLSDDASLPDAAPGRGGLERRGIEACSGCQAAAQPALGVPYDTRLKGLDDDRGTKGLTQDASKSHFKRSTGKTLYATILGEDTCDPIQFHLFGY
ncbi:uncharacterized protein LOC119309409 isoform X1 [Triticum dicoccoides]|uniref:uncharacterized protein LOC119309409 isoform X1 n=2 Tax=Triticum dicoccoides TaxID=85692 RepID=UPI0018911C02|nr:uncharacterized protein LOC119309409 isoform X1 [Triticum dicoccoides]